MNKILTKIGLAFPCIMAMLIIAELGVMVYDEITGTTNCAYCHGTITEDADYVCMTDGRRMHAECYLRYIEEGENGKTNRETP